MRYVALLLSLGLLLSCGTKTAKPPPPSPSKEEQIRRAEKAFEELEREAGKKPEELTLEEPQVRGKETEYRKRSLKLVKREEPRSKYPLVNGLPVWVSNPNYGGVLGGVGVAKRIKGKGYAEQKRLAKQIALADLAKQIEVIVKTELTKVELNIDTQRLKYYKKKFSSYSEQEVRAMLIRNAVVEDEWIDPKTGELYVWVVIR